MTTTNQLYVFGKNFDRFEEITIKQRVDVELVEKAMNFTGTVEEFDDWIESEEIQSLSYDVIVLLTHLYNSPNNGFIDNDGHQKIVDDWNTKRSFHVESEEFTFGVATSVMLAKLEWLSIDNEVNTEEW